MPVLRSTVLVDAAPRTVAGLLRDPAAAADALGRAGHRLRTAQRLLAPGDAVRIAARVLPGLRIPVRTAVDRVSVLGMTSSLVGGPLRELVHTVTLTPAGAGTQVLDEVRWTAPLGPLGRAGDAVLIRRLVRQVLAARSEVLVERVAGLASASVVVATALVRDGRVLVAQRTRPPALAGRWELPGGRVEPGESEAAAVERECREELGALVRSTGVLGTDLPIDVGVLRVHTAELRAGAPEPRPLEHAALRWVGPAELEAVDWVDADRAVVADLHTLLRPPGPPASEEPGSP